MFKSSSVTCNPNFPHISGLFSIPFSALVQTFGWQFLPGFFLEVCVVFLVQWGYFSFEMFYWLTVPYIILSFPESFYRKQFHFHAIPSLIKFLHLNDGSGDQFWSQPLKLHLCTAWTWALGELHFLLFVCCSKIFKPRALSALPTGVLYGLLVGYVVDLTVKQCLLLFGGGHLAFLPVLLGCVA